MKENNGVTININLSRSSLISSLGILGFLFLVLSLFLPILSLGKIIDTTLIERLGFFDLSILFLSAAFSILSIIIKRYKFTVLISLCLWIAVYIYIITKFSLEKSSLASQFITPVYSSTAFITALFGLCFCFIWCYFEYRNNIGGNTAKLKNFIVKNKDQFFYFVIVASIALVVSNIFDFVSDKASTVVAETKEQIIALYDEATKPSDVIEDLGTMKLSIKEAMSVCKDKFYDQYSPQSNATAISYSTNGQRFIEIKHSQENLGKFLCTLHID